MFTQGTISWLFGCHSIGHSILVIISWRKLYGRWPDGRRMICILIHDIGHIGKQYLDNYEEKKKHWRLGAKIGKSLFGEWAWDFLAGHDNNSGAARSDLYKADKYSWYIAPTWWLYLNNIIEPKLCVNCNGKMDAIRKFRIMLSESIESGEYRPTHEMYLDRVNGKG